MRPLPLPARFRRALLLGLLGRPGPAPLVAAAAAPDLSAEGSTPNHSRRVAETIRARCPVVR